MSKGLEALEDLRNHLKDDVGHINVFDKLNLNLIEKELKAIDILKEKNIDIYWLKTSPNLSRYNLAVGTRQKLKKSEYEMLKEVFCND